MWEGYISPTLTEAVADIAAKEARYFIVIDAMKVSPVLPCKGEPRAYYFYHSIWAI